MPGFEPGIKALQASALPLGYIARYRKGRLGIMPLPTLKVPGAEDGVRTRDPDLGKVVLYQLSHFRARIHGIKVCKAVQVYG